MYSPLPLWPALCIASIGFNYASAASIAFTHATIITYNASAPHTEVLYDSTILIENDRISKIYPGSNPSRYPKSTEVIDATGKIISPGFIDTHHHLWQTAYKTLGSNTTLLEYFARFGAGSEFSVALSPEVKYLSQLTGSLELLNAGTTTVLDHAHGVASSATEDAIFDATLESGLRTYHAMDVHATTANWTTQNAIKKLASVASDPRLRKNDIVKVGLAFDSFFSAEPAVLKQLWELVKTAKLSLVTTHHLNAPWPAPNSPTLLNTLGWLNSSVPVVFSHSTFLTGPEASILRQTNQYISVTPESEFHYGHSNPTAHIALDQASLGVDTHFTFSTDMMSQARIWLQTLRDRQFSKVLAEQKLGITNPMSTEQAFYLITKAGALALRRPDLGAIFEGAKADLVVFDGESPGMLGWNDAVAAVILHSNVGDIEHVLVNGEWRKRDGKLVFEGYDRVKRRFLTAAKEVQRAWRSTTFLPTEALAEESSRGYPVEIDTLRGPGTGFYRE